MANIITIQMQSALGNVKSNLLKVKELLSKHKGQKIDLVVLPEFFATSVAYVENATDEKGGEIIKEICSLAREYDTNFIAGSVVRKKKDTRIYNSSFAISRQGNIINIYDKIHLFNYCGGTEGDRITAGNQICTVDFDFAKVGIAICFDIRYPHMFNEFLKQNVDIIVLPTAWIFPSSVLEDHNEKTRIIDMWRAMAKVRAYDNEAFFIICNQVGDVGRSLQGIGNSMVVSPYGDIIANSEEKEEAMITNIDLSLSCKCKQEFPRANIV